MNGVAPDRVWAFAVEERWSTAVEAHHRDLSNELDGPPGPAPEPSPNRASARATGEVVTGPSEDRFSSNVIALQFPARSIPGLDAPGSVLLLAEARDGAEVSLRQPLLRADVTPPSVTFQYRSSEPVDSRWAYTRRAAISQTVIAAPDTDDGLAEVRWLERNDVPSWLLASQELEPAIEWSDGSVAIPVNLPDVATRLDAAERLLMHLDGALRCDDAQPWVWQPVTAPELDALVRRFEWPDDGHTPSVVIDDGGGEVISGRRLAPLANRSIVLSSDGSRRLATVGVA